MRDAYNEALRAYQGSNGDATKALFARLEAEAGAAGFVAMNLFRAHKNSARAKKYRGGDSKGSYRAQAYDRKAWSIGNLCEALTAHAQALGVTWGWAVDQRGGAHSHILYVEIPTGQISFHAAARGIGPEFPKAWDGVRGIGGQRICSWIGRLLETFNLCADCPPPNYPTDKTRCGPCPHRRSHA